MKLLDLKKEAGELHPANTENRINGVKDNAVAPASQEQNLPEIYFDTGRNQYLSCDTRGGWIPYNETQIKRLLRAAGVSPNKPEGAHVSPLDRHLIHLMQDRGVHYAGMLAGYTSGIYEMEGRRILVTESPRLLNPLSGDWPVLRQFFKGLLDDPEHDQLAYFLGWLKIAVESLHAGSIRPGQVLAIAGPRDCGKSLAQKIITEILGGRSAKPYQYMAGLTSFNSDLFTAEHLTIEDDIGSTDMRARRNFGEQIKAFSVNESHRCHPKNREAITLKPFWRVSITLNDEPESMMILPPLDSSIEDKIILLRARKNPLPMPTGTLEQRKAFWAAITAEIPAFLHDLTQNAIPDNIQGERFGIGHFHHPELLQALNELSPESKLLQIIDAVLFSGPLAGTWEGSVARLEQELRSSNYRQETDKLLSFSQACGRYLSRLEKQYPNRISKTHTREGNLWIINPIVL